MYSRYIYMGIRRDQRVLLITRIIENCYTLLCILYSYLATCVLGASATGNFHSVILLSHNKISL